MELLLAGLSHRSAASSARERLAAIPAGEGLRLLQAEGWKEAVVLSTCNRFEVLAAGAGRGVDALAAFLGRLAGCGPEAFYRKSGPAAVEHLFEVVCGLDSLVVGESEILSQVKKAYEAARLEEATGKLTNVLFQRAIFVGKEARSLTAISSGQTSVASVAVTLAGRIFGDLSRSEVLVLGAGKMAELTSRHLLGGKVARLRIANRTWDRALEMAERFGGTAIPWEDFPSALETADILIGSTGSDRPVVTEALLRRVMSSRRGRSLFIIDIAMPRDVEPSAHKLDNVYLYAIEDLAAIVEETLAGRSSEIEAARKIARRRAAEFSGWVEGQTSGRSAPLRHVETVS